MASDNERHYSEKEVGEILRRAAKRQMSLDHTEPGAGLTLAELQRVAGEVNIAPEHIVAAAADLDSPSPGPIWLGIPTARQLERVVDGEVDDLAWERIVVELRTAFGKRGETERVGGTLEWAANNDTISRIDASATAKNGKTRITLLAEYGQGVMMGWMSGLVAGGVLGLVLGKTLYRAHADVAAIVFAVLVPILVGGLGSWLALRVWDRMNLVKLQHTLERISGRVPAPTLQARAAEPASQSEERHVQA